MSGPFITKLLQFTSELAFTQLIWRLAKEGKLWTRCCSCKGGKVSAALLSKKLNTSWHYFTLWLVLQFACLDASDTAKQAGLASFANHILPPCCRQTFEYTIYSK